MYRTILFPTDGSEGSAAALDHAIELADTYDASLHVLFVVDTTYLGVGATETAVVESLRTRGERVVEETVEDLTSAGLDATGENREGDPYSQILDYADDADADLIVMGTHGRRGLDRYLLGSVTEKVVRAADVPVLTVRMKDQD